MAPSHQEKRAPRQAGQGIARERSTPTPPTGTITPLRGVLIGTGVGALVVAFGLAFGQPWATAIWLWPDAPRLSNIFIASVLAAVSVPVIWIGWTGDLGAARGGAINLMVSYAGLSVYLGGLALSGAGLRTSIYAAIFAGTFLLSIAMYWHVRDIPMLDQRPMPAPLRWSFALFALLLITIGLALLRARPNIFPWSITEPMSVVHGWFFVGAATYFTYATIRPSWSNAKGQLLGFLAYDLVLIVPYVAHFRDVLPGHRLSLIVYLAVIGFSGALAAYYLFFSPWRLRSDSETNQPLASPRMA